MGDRRPRAERASAAAVLSAATAAAAIVVGLLYSLGAVLIAGELRATGVAPRDALPLIPLPQLLGRGMSVLLTQFGPALVIVAFTVASIGVAHWIDWRRENVEERIAKLRDGLSAYRERARTGVDCDEECQDLLHKIEEVEASLPDASGGFSGRPRQSLVVFVGLAILVVTFFAPAVAIPFNVVALGILALPLFGRLRLRSAAIVSAVVLWLSVLVTAYYHSPPLATVRATEVGGQMSRGALIAQTGEGIFIAEGDRELRLIPLARLHTVTITSQTKRGSRPPSLFRMIRRALSDR